LVNRCHDSACGRIRRLAGMNQFGCKFHFGKFSPQRKGILTV
jgi:hypothetical protein